MHSPSLKQSKKEQTDIRNFLTSNQEYIAHLFHPLITHLLDQSIGKSINHTNSAVDTLTPPHQLAHHLLLKTLHLVTIKDDNLLLVGSQTGRESLHHLLLGWQLWMYLTLFVALTV